MEKRNICLTITQIRSHINFGNNLTEAKAKKVIFYFVTLKWHRSTCLHCLPKGFYMKNKIKMIKVYQTPLKFEMDSSK